MMFPKDVKVESKKYIAWIKTLPCIECGAPAEPHHLKGVGNLSGGAQKADDIMVMPLCHTCHMEMHNTPSWWVSQWEFIARTLLQAFKDGVIKVK